MWGDPRHPQCRLPDRAASSALAANEDPARPASGRHSCLFDTHEQRRDLPSGLGCDSCAASGAEPISPNDGYFYTEGYAGSAFAPNDVFAAQGVGTQPFY